MSSSPLANVKRRQILFLDDEIPFLEMIQRMAGKWGTDLWDLHVASTASEALSLIQSQAVDLVVIDIQMPVVDGFQFLSLLHRKYPNLQKVVLTSFATDDYRAACLSGGAELFLEKPRTVEGMESIFATLRELARWQPEPGFRGVLRQVGLPDVIQLECLSRHSAVLEISAGGARGEIFIRDGSIIHAQIGAQMGVPAFNELLSLSSGQFNLKAYAEPSATTIDGPWEFLIMEAARLRDEASGPPPPAPAAPAEDTPPPPVPESPLQLATPPVADVGPLPKAAPSAPVDSARSPKLEIEEMLICSSQGAVIHEWHCTDLNARITFLEFISQKSRQLAQGLPLGALDRLELQGAKGRAVVLLQNEYAVLVRSNQATDSTSAPAIA